MSQTVSYDTDRADLMAAQDRESQSVPRVGDVHRALRIGIAFTIALIGARMSAATTSAATPWIALAVSGSPNPAVGHVDPLTFTGTATPHGGTFHDVVITMTLAQGYECSPASTCQVSEHWVNWTFATISSKVTFKVHTNVLGPASVYVASCNPESCLNQPASTIVNPPTVGASVSYSPAGAIRSGENVRFTVHGTTNVGPVGTEIRTGIAAGLEDPTDLSAGAGWNPADHDVYSDLILDRTGSYSFSAVVTAKLGADIKLVLDTVNDPNTEAPDATRTVLLKVGPVAAPTPRPTPRPTVRPTLAPTPRPPSSSTAPSQSPTTPDVPIPVTPAAPPSDAPGSAPQVGAVAPDGSPGPPPSPEATTSLEADPAASTLLVSGFLGFLAVLIIGGVIAVGHGRRRVR